MPCDCIPKINDDLAVKAPNTIIETNIFGRPRAFILTCKRHEKQRGKPARLQASYCPFCGEKYFEEPAS